MFQACLVVLVLGLCQGHDVLKRAADKPSLRIYNGDDADAGEFPFIGLILASTGWADDGISQNMCGCSFLSDRIVLTAAHCVVRDIITTDTETIDEIYYPRNLEIYAGETDTDTEESSEQIMKVSGVIVHEDYDSFTIENDIAMIILAEPLTLNANVATIALPEDADVKTLYADGAAITVIGWGTTESGSVTNDLQKLSYTVSTDSDCKDEYGSQLLDGMMCTGTSPMNVHSGAGDSGGPLFTKKDDKWTQLALVSWGPATMTETTYDVNSNVSYYKSWINANKDIALTDYVASLTATGEIQSVTFSSLRNYLYKTILVAPTDTAKYTKITIKSGTMKTNDFLMIYDGDSVLDAIMLAQLSGTLSEQSFTASTTNGLTVAIMTSKSDKSDGFTFEYSQVTDAGTLDTLTCASGFTACTDKLYCVNNALFCDDNGDCQDQSDEVTENCDNTDNNTDNDNDNDEDKDEDDNNTDSDGVECYNCMRLTALTLDDVDVIEEMATSLGIPTTCVAANKTTCATSEICFSYTVELTMAAGDSSLEMHVGAHGCASADFEETFTDEACQAVFAEENIESVKCTDLKSCTEDCLEGVNSSSGMSFSIVMVTMMLFKFLY